MTWLALLILAARLAAAQTGPADPFAWLEDGKNPKVKKWAEDQNRAARATLDALPGRDGTRERLEALMGAGSLSGVVQRGARVFYLKRAGLQNQPVLYVRDTPAAEPRVILDPNRLSADGAVALDWWHPSHDGGMLAYGLSEKGSEDSVLHVREIDSDLDRPDLIERTRHCSLAWAPDRSGFYYTRYPRAGTVPPGEERYHRWVYFHTLGENPLKDEVIFGPGRAKEDWPDVAVSEDHRRLIITVSQGWSKTELFFKELSDNTTTFLMLAGGRQAVYEAQIEGDSIFMRTNEDAPLYKIVRIDFHKPYKVFGVSPAVSPTDRKNWRVIVPEGRFPITGFRLAGSGLAVESLERAAARLTLYNRDGSAVKEIPLPPLGSVTGFDAGRRSTRVDFLYQSFFIPPTLYSFDSKTSSLSVLDAIVAPMDPAEFESRQVVYPSKDMTPVTMFLLHKKRLKRDRNAPTLLTGYGGFNVSMTPVFSPSLLLWLEQGGLYALPNLRGGGEYGESWHRAGMLQNKQNTFDDFIAAARWLIDKEYTRPERLAIMGASNGGLLVGAALTQAPQLFRAVVCGVPLLDMMRYHLSLIGRLWIAEYGSPDVPEQARWLAAYSPYHRVLQGTRYPAMLLLSGASDTRVDPMHARKMAARLQKNSASGLPVLLRLESKAGHGAGKPLATAIDEWVDRYGFLFWQLGVKPPAASKPEEQE